MSKFEKFMRKVAVVFASMIIGAIIGVALTVTVLNSGMHLSIPRFEVHWDKWTENYDLGLDIASQDSEESVTTPEAEYASR